MTTMISYSRKDWDRVEPVMKFLRSNGISIGSIAHLRNVTAHSPDANSEAVDYADPAPAKRPCNQLAAS